MVSATFARNVLAFVLTITTAMYLAPVANQDGRMRRTATRQGFWGTPTGDFDWCEENYPYSEGPLRYVAEPFNTLTNLAWLFLTLGCGCRLKWLNMLDVQAVLGLLLAAMIGSGSFVFHATLLYEAQLSDELPMLNFIILSSLVAYNRPTPTEMQGLQKKSPAVTIAVVVFGLSCVPWMYLTARESFAHVLGRVLMVICFTTCFVYLGYSTVKCVDELREVLPDKGHAVERCHTLGFVLCVSAIVAWASDSAHCDFWQNLPFGLPYPQLHALVWHNFMILVIIFVILLQVQHRQAFQVCASSMELFQKEPQRAQVFQSMLPFNLIGTRVAVQ